MGILILLAVVQVGIELWKAIWQYLLILKLNIYILYAYSNLLLAYIPYKNVCTCLPKKHILKCHSSSVIFNKD